VHCKRTLGDTGMSRCYSMAKGGLQLYSVSTMRYGLNHERGVDAGGLADYWQARVSESARLRNVAWPEACISLRMLVPGCGNQVQGTLATQRYYPYPPLSHLPR